MTFTDTRSRKILLRMTGPGIGSPSSRTAISGTGEFGAPLCAGAGNGVDTSTGGSDRRIIYAAIVNCLAQGPFPSGSNANNVPVAGFGKFFMTQPIFADGDSTRPLYGEFTGFREAG